jgi:hypothetical protein
MKTVAGYSGTPLAKKLGIKSGGRLLLLGAPDHYRRLLEPLPAAVRLVPKLSSDTDLVHVFTTKRATLQKALKDCRRALGRTRRMGVVAEEGVEVREAGDRGHHPRAGTAACFVDVKVCARS